MPTPLPPPSGGGFFLLAGEGVTLRSPPAVFWSPLQGFCAFARGAQGRRGLWSEGGGEAVREGFTAFHPRGTRLSACLKMAGDPPAAQVSKDARERDKGMEGTKGRAFLQSCGRAALFLRSTFFLKTGVKRPALSRGAGAAQAPAYSVYSVVF